MNQSINKRGFSVVEFLIAIGIALIVLLVVTLFARNIFMLNLSSQASLNAQIESRKILNQLVGELRSASPSAQGSYPIESAATSSIIFFADVNADNNADRIRFFLDVPTRTLKRGLVLAAGSPPSYNLGSETLSTIMNEVSNGTSTPVFDYFDGNYAGTSTALTIPVNISSIRLVRVTLRIDKDINRTPEILIFTSGASLRNLKDNL